MTCRSETSPAGKPRARDERDVAVNRIVSEVGEVERCHGGVRISECGISVRDVAMVLILCTEYQVLSVFSDSNPMLPHSAIRVPQSALRICLSWPSSPPQSPAPTRP